MTGRRRWEPAAVRLAKVHADDLELLDLYVVAMRRRHLADGTIAKRRSNIEIVAGVARLADLTGEDFEQFLDERDVNARTRYCWISHLSCFYEWAVTHEHLERNPLRKLQRPKMRRLVPKPTREAEVDLAIAMAPTARMRAWITLAAFAGLRCCEIAGLRGDDIDRDARTLRVVGKGDKPRVVPMHTRVLEALADAPPTGVVFRDEIFGQPYEPENISHFGGKYMRSIGLTNVAMHQLRHRFATALLDAGIDILTVADLMGHENLNTTRGYTLVSNERMRNAVDALG